MNWKLSHSLSLALIAASSALNLSANDAPAGKHIPAEDSKVHYRTATVNGLKMFYREAGLADAPVIVLLHGSPGSSHMFRDLMPLLAGRSRVIAPDYIGFGYSDAPPKEQFAYTFDNLARQLDDFLGELKLQRYTLYMQDYGGPIGMRLAVAHPERITGLIIQNANAYLEGFGADVLNALQPLWTNRTTEAEARVRIFISPDGIRSQYHAGVQNHHLLNPDAWTLANAMIRRPGHEEIELELLADYKTNLEQYPVWQEYLRRHQPQALIVWGRHDPIFIAAGAEAYRRDLPKAKLVWLEAGHFALEECAPEVGLEIINTFASNPDAVLRH
jgi:pimeloyl-ACP methyl ester carboxylesterase